MAQQSPEQRTSTLPIFQTGTPGLGWENGVIAGSGRVGALVFGTGASQIVSLAHEHFFLPVNAKPDAPELAPVLSEIRDAVLSGRHVDAGRIMMEGASRSGYGERLVWTDPLGMCATLTVQTPMGRPVRRTVDLEHGEVAVVWEAGDDEVVLRVLAPRDGETVWVAVESREGAAIDVELGLLRAASEKASPYAVDYSSAVRAVASGGETARVEASAGGGEMVAVTTVRGPVPWTVTQDGAGASSRVRIDPGGRAVFRVDVTVSSGAAVADGESDQESWDILRERQRDGHGSLIRRSVLDLGGTTDYATTEQLWDSARGGDHAARRRVAEVAYLSGRANAIASTGELPPTLQGVWQGTWSPPWSADFTMNGNVQNGGIASLIPTGTPELAASLLRLVLPYLDDYRRNARNIFGADGMLLPARMSNHGRANHFAAAYPHIFWTGCGGWVLRFAADLVSTTGDRAVVDDGLWELVEGVLEFGETATTWLDGRRHFIPSYSPENAPFGDEFPLAVDATMDVAILRDAARCGLLLAEARGDHSLDERWRRLAAELPGYRTAEDGTLAEWIHEPWPEQHEHRHTSQLYPLWYEVDEAFVGGAVGVQRLRDAARRTIQAKLGWRGEAPYAPGHMEMAFGLVQLGLAAAALGEADAALRCVEWLAIEHWTPALTTTHDAGRIFNVDASGGLPAVVAAMLLGSERNELTVLPALPAEWPQGAVTGLRARGGVVVDRLSWDDRGATLELHRAPEASWLAKDGTVLIRAPRDFTIHGAADGERSVRVDSATTSVRLLWR
ncbi:MAG: glycoside hydrolase N-terminal domain-containing protein [Actinomycetota bacterium]|nr:glycoside hydrolase N-terminal domain-containing protein [Actinomycetota bacterium]